LDNPRVLCIFGTRPEAIKMAPVIQALREYRELISLKVCVTGQHRQMLDQVLRLFGIDPEYDLDIMRAGQDLYGLTAALIRDLKAVIAAERPDLVLVHGDTTTTMAASLAAYYGQAAVGHVEAGLRTGDKFRPFPEEMNRRLTGALADLHFAPTERARRNLLREGVGEAGIFVTGNTVIDALFQVREKIERSGDLRRSLALFFPWIGKNRRIVVITGHRRENFGRGMEEICNALVDLAGQWPEVDFVYPVHLNPNVLDPVNQILGSAGRENLRLIEPLDYLQFVYLLMQCDVVLTDSGGIQEEAPSLGKPVVVMRETTERPEAVEAGTVLLAGSSRERIVHAVSRLLSDSSYYSAMSRALNPYGDGRAGPRIARAAIRYLKLKKEGEWFEHAG
jgi:UDP-N-acetylglucosamine 2-epimerase (non-hydrolysing)